MTLNNIKTMKKDRGFTLVELLIVIVVIAILAAITIVAYNGIQQRANTTSANTSANTFTKKVEAYNAANSAYPVSVTQMNAVAESSISNSNLAVGTPSASNGKTTLKVEACGVTGTSPNQTAAGVKVSYWDYSAGTPAVPATPQYTAGVTTGTCVAFGS